MRPSDKRLREAACWGGSALPLNPEREGDGVSRGDSMNVDDMIAAERVRADRAEAERDALAAALHDLNEWTNRMPDAGFNDRSPRWAWWTEGVRFRDAAVAALAAVSTPEEER